MKKSLETDFGYPDVKAEALTTFCTMLETLEPAYRTSVWSTIHALDLAIYDAQTNARDAVDFLLQIIRKLLDARTERLIEDKDLHFAEEVFNKMIFLYATNFSELEDGTLHKLVSIIDGPFSSEQLGAYRAMARRLRTAYGLPVPDDEQELTIDEATYLCAEATAELPSTQRKSDMLHAKLVGEMAVILARNKLDNKTLRIAGWLHDIGRARTDENHAELSVQILEEKGYALSPVLKDCILNHGKDCEPATAEGRAFQAADKVSVFNPEIIDLILHCDAGTVSHDDLAFLAKMSERALKLLEQYK